MEKQITDALVVEEISKTALAETKAPEPEMAEASATAPPPEISATEKPARRDTVRPEERDFPL